ncbi:vacuolar ATPase assembly integral membrane protein vma21 [Apophysomyces sp. BC1034]|nr:vacuolar ATPase assembly integral membrane protein vma21 [Apophysomyces sp. BC1015]KAG0177481.1 vacuolar ATPase assembly integral membrane protein vma21 [Apophysomyces sp. BC1021]KAG0187741.1 vacuolar ATPase assembly integral membrane protein vma21 [Apophysomyces sp. BC1034]
MASASSAVKNIPGAASAPQKAAVSRSVVFKLIAFSLAMCCIPILTYFLTIDKLFEGNGTYAAGAAAGMANVVALSYVVAAVLEDKDEKDKKD